jgi:thymidine phosphorylase
VIRVLIGRDSSDDELATFTRFVRDHHPSDVTLAAELAQALADSGEHFDPGPVVTADVASTGGPSSLTTLICPLILSAAGVTVPKLGVPGRPAGGIDCLAQIPGYRTELDDRGLASALAQARYAHFLSAGRYAPLDARLFEIRKRETAQAIPTLVAASLLSKKIAVGVQNAGLDIRAARHGNFGRTLAEAQRNATLYEQVGQALGINGRPVVSDGSRPYQPYIGRGEALVALLSICEPNLDVRLSEHVGLCLELCRSAVPAQAATFSVEPSRFLASLECNVEAQGGSLAALKRKVAQVLEGHRLVIRARRDGLVVIDLGELRQVLVEAQKQGIDRVTSFPDGAGLILHAKVGEPVCAGQILATVRVDNPAWASPVLDKIAAAVHVV